jgi:hypothetical protein
VDDLRTLHDLRVKVGEHGIRLDNLEQWRDDQKDLVVTKHEFYPVRALAYGIAGIILSAVLVAFLKLVIVG